MHTAASSKNSHKLKQLFITSLLDFTAFGIIMPLLPFIFSTNPEKGLFAANYTQPTLTTYYGLLLGVFSICSFLSSPLLGALSDRIGRKKVFLLAYLVNFVSYGLILSGCWLQSISLFFIARILHGCLGVTQITLQSAIADLSTPQTSAKNFGIVGVTFGLGFVVGILIDVGLQTLHWFSYELAIGLAMGICFVNIIYLHFFMPETLQNPTHKPLYWFTGVLNVKKAFSEPRFRLLFLTIFALTIGFIFFVQFFQYFVTLRFHLDFNGTGLILIYTGLLIALMQQLALPWFSKRFEPKILLRYFIPLFGLGFAALLLPTQVWQLVVMLPLLVFFQSIVFPCLLALVSDLATPSEQGQIMGINQSVQALANALPPILIGFAVGHNVAFALAPGMVGSLIATWLYFRYQAKSKLQSSISSFNKSA
ncbi:MAG: MFS transporter [Chitinophagales bacterium]|nr:MFS transporter [Sphingobacteriales bacterium]MBK6889626.1 MFS transporter [Sphingobacteriales bacterium]MBK8678849.1 MFS transporter [Sphingobacteriales bacterium]MCC7057267.1 MFS transporter [Chitinophagales bacterium]